MVAGQLSQCFTVSASLLEFRWRELHHRLLKYYKDMLSYLDSHNYYDQSSPVDKDLLSYCFIPVIKKDLQEFKDVVWNQSRGRYQALKQVPTGIPDFIFENPETFGSECCGKVISSDILVEVVDEVQQFGLDITQDNDFLTDVEREVCEAICPLRDINKMNIQQKYLELREGYYMYLGQV